MPKLFFEIVPPIYRALMPKSVLNLDVTERSATCGDCLRSRDKRFAYPYNAKLKCCTFHPYLPNFAVGALLVESKQNRDLFPSIENIERKIFEREFNLPVGLLAPFNYQFRFLNREKEDFGNDEGLLCPYYDREHLRCGIWQYRGVVCTTYFCRSDYGQDGLKFWAVLSDYLSYVEMALAEECLVQLDFSPRDLSDQLAYLNKHEFSQDELNQNQLSLQDLKRLWNGYSDAVDFYKKCFAIVSNIDRNQFKEIIGSQGLSLEKEVIEYAHRRKNRIN